MCCDSGSSTPPAPDPLIGQAALNNSEIGKDWLDFSKQQFATSQDRQVAEDALVKKVVDSGLATQDQANQWAAQDRQIGQKYQGWADQDRAAGQRAQAELNGLGNSADANAQMYEQTFGKEAGRQSQFGQDQMGRYNSTFRPIEDRIAIDAMNWDSPERQESEAAKAKADVAMAAGQQRGAQQRQMAAMGVSPASGRFAGIERATDTATALGEAGAQNSARDLVRQQGIQLRGQAAQVGQQVLGTGQQANAMSTQDAALGQTARMNGITTNMQAKNLGLAAAGVGSTSAGLSLGSNGSGYSGLGLGLNAGQSAVGAQGAGNASFMAGNGIMGQGFSGAIGANGSAAAILNNQYGNQLNAWSAGQQANAQSSAGMGSFLGTVAGAGITAF